MKTIYRLHKEPFASRIVSIFEKNTHRQLRRAPNGDGIIDFTYEEVYNLAKASGLRSKKQRHINKRFKRVMLAVLDDLVEKYGKDKRFDNKGTK